eukprot:TRINITY_DN9028_c0_g1_i5.p1 TRINITY_DN9028_c0_g1~~TRINITY_DN9028_c0_g1_i5.p1  ORF type:complete len:115 (+),score=22.95 TRINITY_DN9028_c0_g1_i5:21-365(+)
MLCGLYEFSLCFRYFFFFFFFLMIRRPPRSTLSSSSAASDVYKRQNIYLLHTTLLTRPHPINTTNPSLYTNNPSHLSIENTRMTRRRRRRIYIIVFIHIWGFDKKLYLIVVYGR